MPFTSQRRQRPHSEQTAEKTGNNELVLWPYFDDSLTQKVGRAWQGSKADNPGPLRRLQIACSKPQILWCFTSGSENSPWFQYLVKYTWQLLEQRVPHCWLRYSESTEYSIESICLTYGKCTSDLGVKVKWPCSCSLQISWGGGKASGPHHWPYPYFLRKTCCDLRSKTNK